LFQRKLQKDPEFNDIRDISIANKEDVFNKSTGRAKILAHAYENVGEFISCAISNKEV